MICCATGVGSVRGWTSVTWGLTPQFNVTAPLAARMWTALTGQQVNGVMALDVVGVKQLLVATGPVRRRRQDDRTPTTSSSTSSTISTSV